MVLDKNIHFTLRNRLLILLIFIFGIISIYVVFPDMVNIGSVEVGNGSALFTPNTLMNDRRLLHYLRLKIKRLEKPVNGSKYPTNTHWSQMDESQLIDKILKNMTKGFFVECGASDGVTYSNSLFFEVTRNWTGLLIEANSGMFKNILSSGRGVYAYNGCLSPGVYPQILKFKESSFLGGLSDSYKGKRKHVMAQTAGREVNVECVPLYSLLLALDVRHVNYFSLDTEGSEIEILKSIPFDKIQIDVISVEFIIWGGTKQDELNKKNELKHLFAQTNLYQEAVEHRGDLFFLRK